MSTIQLDMYTIRWVMIWLKDKAQSVVIFGLTSSSWTVTGSAPLGPVLGSVLLDVFINDLDTGVDCTPRKFANKKEPLIPSKV